MRTITLSIHEDLLLKVRQLADARKTTLEALIVEHLTVLADRAGRRLTLREQMYVDYRPAEAVVETVRAEAPQNKS